MHRISVNLTNDYDGNQLNYNNDVPAIRNKNYALQKPFKAKKFLNILKRTKNHFVLLFLLYP